MRIHITDSNGTTTTAQGSIAAPPARKRHWVRNTLLAIGAFFLLAYAYGSHLQAAQATVPAPVATVPVCTTYEVALSDAAHRQGNDVRLACDDAGTTDDQAWTDGALEAHGIPTPVADATVTAPQATVTTTPPAATVTAPQVTVTEYPEDSTVTAEQETSTVHAPPVFVTEQETHTLTPTAEPPATAPAQDITPCQFEDGSGFDQAYPCLWDSATMGNHQGTGHTIYSGPDQISSDS